jgi:hypothetical protein
MGFFNDTFWMSLVKLGVFSIFITAIVEVIKHAYLIVMNKKLSTGICKNLNFFVTLLYCKVFNYGVMSNLLQIDLKTPTAYFLDYIGTAAVIYMGAGWIFDQFAAVRSKLEAQKIAPLGLTTTDKTSTTTTTASESSTVPVPQ